MGKLESPLRSIATKVTLCNGDLDVWFLPYTPNISSIMRANLQETLMVDGQWFVAINHFINVNSCLIDVEITNTDTEDINARALDIWFNAKTGNDLDDYTLYFQAITSEFATELFEDGYEATRPKLPKAPEITQQVVPGSLDPLEQSGKNGTGKRTKKRIKSTS